MMEGNHYIIIRFRFIKGLTLTYDIHDLCVVHPPRAVFSDRFFDRTVCGVQKRFVYTVKLGQAVLACV